jgi:hypothetical protein
MPKEVIAILAIGGKLDIKYKDHKLTERRAILAPFY